MRRVGRLLLSIAVCSCGEAEQTCYEHDGSGTITCVKGHEPSEVARHEPSEEGMTYTPYHFEDLAEPRLVQDQTHVYWVSGAGDVLRTAKTSLETSTIYTNADCGVVALELAVEQLYLALNCRGADGLLGSVWSLDTAGNEPVELYRSASGLMGLAVDPEGSWVYAIEDVDSARRVVAIEPVSRAMAALTLGERLRGLTATPGYVYAGWYDWVEDGSTVVVEVEAATGYIRSFAAAEAPAALEAFGDQLYLREEPAGDPVHDNRLQRLDLGDPEPSFESALQGTVPHWFTLSDGHVYGGGIYELDGSSYSTIVRFRVPDGGAEPLVVLAAGLWISGVVVDDAHVYWVDYDEPFLRGTSRLMRTAR
jgi:hypothetical protein